MNGWRCGLWVVRARGAHLGDALEHIAVLIHSSVVAPVGVAACGHTPGSGGGPDRGTEGVSRGERGKEQHHLCRGAHAVCQAFP